jgi:hypothetical protein
MNYSVDWDGPGEREATHVVCSVPPGTKEDAFQPFPGSEVAIAKGCTCPTQRDWPHTLKFSLDCPVHELEKTPH